MQLVLVDYTIQALWSFFTHSLIMDRKTKTASGEEEMLARWNTVS
jgi:hypothetical protein